jgi:hypothetical protein
MLFILCNKQYLLFLEFESSEKYVSLSTPSGRRGGVEVQLHGAVRDLIFVRNWE